MANKANTKIIFVKAEDRFSFPCLHHSFTWMAPFHSFIQPFIQSHEHMKMEMSTENTKFKINTKLMHTNTSNIAKSLKRNLNIRVKRTNI